MNYDISFVIPTRNRIKNLSILLNRLLPQFDKNCKLIIVDNASDEFDIYDLKKIIEGFPSINFEILRNKVNIGIDANVVKTFEIPDTQWIFPLGDSKLVSTNCVQKIKEYIQKYADASFINFYFQDIFHEPRYKNIVINEKEDFSKMIDCFGNILLFGNTVYRRNAVQPHISQGYRFIYARCPHVAIAIESINEGYGVLSHEAVLDVMLNKPSMQDLPGIVDCWDSFSFIPYIFNTEESRYRMNKLVAGIDFRGQPISWFLYKIPYCFVGSL